MIIWNYTLFDKGCYYTTSGQKVTGYVKLRANQKHITFKADSNSGEQIISINSISAIKSPKYDSLTVLVDSNRATKYFAKLVCVSPITKFYYRSKNFGSPAIFALTNTASKYNRPTDESYVNIDIEYLYGTDNLTHALTKKNYKAILLKALADVPELARQIQNNSLGFKNLDQIFMKYNFERSKPR